MDDRVGLTESEDTTPLSQPTRLRRWAWRGRLLALLLLVLAGAGLWYWLAPHSAPNGRRTNASTAAQPVGAATIDTGDIRVVLNELGTVTPLVTVTVKTQINGQLTQVAFQEGQMVKRGDFLAQVDDRTFRATLQRDQGQLAHDQGLLDEAQADLQRFATLGRQDSIAQQQVQDQRYVVQQDIGTVRADQGTVANDELNVAYCHIISPADGRIGLRQVDPGNYVQTTDATGIVVITQMQPMSVLFSVPQQALGQIEAQIAKGAALPVAAYDQSNSTEIDQGQLATIDNQMDTATGMVKMRALFSNAQNTLFPNQFVNAHLLVSTLANVLRVPVQAVQLGANGSFVWVIGADNAVAARVVKLGTVDGQFQQVISGLQQGDRVVTDGTDRLRDGMKVVVPPPTPAAQGSATPAPQQHRRAGAGQPRQPAEGMPAQ
jgi:multidrug efflux system membrane fusion protein